MLRVKLVRSPIGNTKRNRATVTALGLRKMHQSVTLPDNESVRGMIFRVKHMLAVEVVEGEERKNSTPKRARTGNRDRVTKGIRSKDEGRRTKVEAQHKTADQAERSEQTEKAAPQAEKPKAQAKPKPQSKVEGQKPKVEGQKAKNEGQSIPSNKSNASTSSKPSKRIPAKPKSTAKKKEQK